MHMRITYTRMPDPELDREAQGDARRAVARAAARNTRAIPKVQWNFRYKADPPACHGIPVRLTDVCICIRDVWMRTWHALWWHALEELKAHRQGGK